MSYYPADLTRCFGCGARFFTPIDCHQHKQHCQVHRTPEGWVPAKIGTHGSEAIKTRNVIAIGRIIRIQRFDGTKTWAHVTGINNAVVFLEICDQPGVKNKKV